MEKFEQAERNGNRSFWYIGWLDRDLVVSTYQIELKKYGRPILRGLDFSYAYIDDVLIASSNPEQHQEHLRTILEHFQEHEVINNPTKYVFGVSQLQFLGHHVDSQGIRPLEEKVSALCQFPQPTTWRKLREFLGLINFYRQFLPNCASILQPFHDPPLMMLNSFSGAMMQWRPLLPLRTVSPTSLFSFTRSLMRPHASWLMLQV